MVKTLRARSTDNIKNKMRGKCGSRIKLATKNAMLSAQVEAIRKRENRPVLKVNEDGVVLNLDYNNPQHLRWLED